MKNIAPWLQSYLKRVARYCAIPPWLQSCLKRVARYCAIPPWLRPCLKRVARYCAILPWLQSYLKRVARYCAIPPWRPCLKRVARAIPSWLQSLKTISIPPWRPYLKRVARAIPSWLQSLKTISIPPWRPYLKRVARYCAICVVMYPVIAAVVIYTHKEGLPSFEKLEDVDPAQTTHIFSQDRVELKKFWVQRRDPIAFDQLPQTAIDALIATEDRRFWQHWGVSIPDIIRVVFRNVYVSGTLKGHGASTVTQQLARNIFLTLDPTWKRKIQEQLTAVLLERTYTKRELITMYFNQVYFGNSAYGIQTATRRFFGKNTENLTLEESALLVGLLKGPTTYSPLYRPQRARDRRDNVVLYNMRQAGAITEADYRDALQRPIVLAQHPEEIGQAPYFTEYIRKYLERAYGVNVLYDGATVQTTLDSRLQRIAEEVVSRKVTGQLKDRVAANWKYNPPDKAFFDNIKTRRDTLANLVLQGALVALDPRTGHILAMVGGRDFEESKFNRATQALRQPGSSFKPFIYAAAIDEGYTPTWKLPDTAVSIKMSDGTYWQPENYDHKFLGWMTLREGLAGSRNVVTTKVLQKVGPKTAVQYAKKMGIDSRIFPVLSLGMGTSEVKLLELVSAYGTLSNKGIRVAPVAVLKIEDKNGNVLEENFQGRERAVLSEETAAVTVNLLRSVLDMRQGHNDAILNGTGRSARTVYGFRRPAAGKTGTTQNYADAWFIGFTPQLVCGVWVGFDSKVSMGSRMSGASVALPIWAEFMKRAHDILDLPVEDFALPPNIPQVEICGDTHQVASIYCAKRYLEVFKPGTEPKRPCPTHTPNPQTLPPTDQPKTKREYQF